ncbi:MAG: hypothetical protein IJ289_07650 [Clostridia bacterium]|nr:hypothetical protein [Clostridia bacterium]
MDNKKKLTIVLAVFAVVCVFAVLVFSGVLDSVIHPGEEQTTDAEGFAGGSDYSADVLASADNSLPYLKTDMEHIFYTMSTTGEVNFFALDENTFFPVEATGTYDVSVTMSERKVSTTVTYYEEDGVISGYGLYTGSTDEFDLYPYAFFRLTNFGSRYEDASEGTCMLLVDTTADDFYSNDKIFEEPFVFDTEDSSASRHLSEANRTVGLNGAKRADYSMVNDAAIDGSFTHQIFFSGRQYAEDDERVDLLRSGGSGNNTDNINLAKDVLGYWADQSEDGVTYITTDDNGNVIVEKLNEDSDETSVIKTFDGVKREDILVSDDCIYVLTTNSVYDISDDKEVKLTFGGADKFRADMFECDGDRIFVRGYSESKYAVAVVAEKATGSVTAVYSDEIFRSVVNPIFSGDSLLVTVQDGNNFRYYIF